ncbi:MAG TPA: AAA family ATPase [Streptosporangiaceae bacterium]|nr:AAA family ATPase [Streptosporangiaceae bacterium]
MGRDALPAAGERTQVELRLAGPFGVTRDGAELAEHQIGSRKSRMLLKLLAASSPALLSPDLIAEVLWAGAPPAGADRNIASLISRLRAVLGAEIIEGGRTGYRLGDEPAVSVDLDVAARLCDQAEGKLAQAPALALAAAARAADLLGAGVAIADEPYADWADAARQRLSTLLRRARLTAAQAALATGDPELSARYAEAAIAADGLDEPAHRLYMSAAAAGGEHARALLTYEALRERLAAELGTDPAPPTRDLHLAILREDPRATAHGPGTGRPAELPPASARPPAEPGPALVGRAREIAELRAAWSRAAAAEPGVVMIVGEAGIGKTALAEFIAAEAAGDGATVFRTRCYETERSLFLQPIVEALDPVVSRMSAAELRDMLGPHIAGAATVLPAAADVLGQVPAAHGTADIERRRAFDALTTLLRALAVRHPVLLVVDDVQYAGHSTVELLHFLGRQLSGSRLLVVVTVRAENSADIGAALEAVAVPLEVGPLDRDAVTKLANDAGQGSVAADILHRTRGHTLFVVEVLRALRGGEEGVPSSLRATVASRVRRAGASVETALRAAAVLGSAVDPLMLSDLLGLTGAAAVERCEQALSARLLVVSGRHYEFANDLIREVMYATTPEPTRLAYHRGAADLLTAQPEALAEHAAACGDWQRAARAWLLASETAMQRFAASDAALLATKALDAADRAGAAEVAVRARIARGRVHEAIGDHVAALADFTAGADRARAIGDRRQEMYAMRELGGDTPVALGLPITFCESHLAAGLRIAESLGDRGTEADLLSRLAIVAGNRFQFDAALNLGRRAVAAARATADEQALITGLDGLKGAYLNVGDAASLGPLLAELLPVAQRHGDLVHVQWAEFDSAFLAFAAADWETAEARIQAALLTNRRSGYPSWAGLYAAHLGLIARLRGRDADAIQAGRDALATADQHGHSWSIAVASATLGSTLLTSAAAAAESTALFEHGLSAAETDGTESYVLRCLAPLAYVTRSPDLLERADRLLAQAASKAGAWIPGYQAYLALARAWPQHGEPEHARELLEPLLKVARDAPWIPVLAEALAVDGGILAAIGQGAEARAALRQSARLAADHEMPRLAADAQAALSSLN